MKKLILTLCLALGLVGGASAAEGGIAWDKFPAQKMNDMAALQNGAKVFANYCLNCHAAAFMRYNRLRDIGLTEDQIKQNLMFPTDKVGETMKVSIDPRQAKDWFGGVPPDLTVIARSRAGHGGTGADYLYTYLRTYYRDDTKPTGWNNLAFPNVGMPHVLWQLQGQRAARFEEKADPHDHAKKVHVFAGFEQLTPGTMAPQAYDDMVGDLVAYLQWMGEPAQSQRVRVGVWVLLFLGLFTVIAWRLNAAFWKDVK
ncbi:cytochrome c1 [Piscinibacter sakaiensis]|uniref:Ubiquinol cytochrome C oxidoreductase, cytochrome C1 subunit n=1 Tax=Piscinibacter sakaiensis TaxID=1547922 RepID=A0A0K8NYD5_PISS1|nr:cytochrome c1 [Piscinibacter sakaiensis]GAP35304.1 ubiquinol cytochrome C oxidoreductase, cytochrome C1 subunit [Piscinibacter sakaiensis]